MNRISINHLLAAIVAVYALVFALFPHTENLPADGGIKILQIRDFIKKNYSSFSAVYNGTAMDPDFAFFPMPEASYKVNNEMYYTFPFYITVFFTPAYLFFGVHGINVLCAIFGLLTVLACCCIARELRMSETNIKLMVIFTGLASIILPYSFIPGEFTPSAFLVTISALFILRGKRKNSTLYFVLAGLSAGLSTFFRIESGLYCLFLFIGVLVFKMYANPKTQPAGLFAALSLCAIVLMAINYHVTGNILGFLGNEFSMKSGGNFSLSERLFNLFEAFFLSTSRSTLKLGLFAVWPIYAFLFLLFRKKFRIGDTPHMIHFFIFITVPFLLILPLVVNIDDGSILGPRFLLLMQPLLTVLVFLILDQEVLKSGLARKLAVIAVCYSILFMTAGLVILYNFEKISDDVNKKVSGHARHAIVIVHNSFLYGSIIPLFDERTILYANEPKDWETIVQRAKASGIRNFSVIDFAKGSEAIRYPPLSAKIRVDDRFTYHGNFKKTIVENITITY